MSDLITSIDAQCPYCGQRIEIDIDISVAHQEFIEDCEVCCRPIRFVLYAGDPLSPVLEAFTEDD